MFVNTWNIRIELYLNCSYKRSWNSFLKESGFFWKVDILKMEFYKNGFLNQVKDLAYPSYPLSNPHRHVIVPITWSFINPVNIRVKCKVYIILRSVSFTLQSNNWVWWPKILQFSYFKAKNDLIPFVLDHETYLGVY